MAWYNPFSWGDESQSSIDKRDDLNEQGSRSSNFADAGELGYGATGAEAQQARNYLRDLAQGKNSLASEQLRQGLQQQQAQQMSMAAGAPTGSGPMAARTAMMGMGRASSAMAGNAAMAGIAERAAAQKAWSDAILGARGQDLQASLGGRQNAIGAYSGVTPDKSFLDKWGGAILGGASIAASDRNLKTDINDADREVDALLDGLNPYAFRYLDEERHGHGRRVGIMAQDLQASLAGRELVIETDEGLMVDLHKAIPVLLATVARLNARVRELEGR